MPLEIAWQVLRRGRLNVPAPSPKQGRGARALTQWKEPGTGQESASSGPLTGVLGEDRGAVRAATGCRAFGTPRQARSAGTRFPGWARPRQ